MFGWRSGNVKRRECAAVAAIKESLRPVGGRLTAADDQ